MPRSGSVLISCRFDARLVVVSISAFGSRTGGGDGDGGSFTLSRTNVDKQGFLVYLFVYLCVFKSSREILTDNDDLGVN